MTCKVCNSISITTEDTDCFENAVNMLKSHFVYYKNALQQRELELQQLNERNQQLNKALKLLQKNVQPAKRFKSQLGSDCLSEDKVASDLSLTDDEPIGATDLNIAINSEQLFESSTLSQIKNNDSVVSSSEIVLTPLVKVSPRRNKQHDAKRCSQNRNNKSLERTKLEWCKKGHNSPVEKSWATKFLQSSKATTLEEKPSEERKKTIEKKLCLSLKKSNTAKIKQSLLVFNKEKDANLRGTEMYEDIIDASPIKTNKDSKAGRSWPHRSGQSYNSITNKTLKTEENSKSADDIIFDFSPSKKTDSIMNSNFSPKIEPTTLQFDANLGISTNNSDSSVVILTPSTQDIIFVDDTEIDGINLSEDAMKPTSTDNLKGARKYESKCKENQQKIKGTDQFKKPLNMIPNNKDIPSLAKIKQEQITQENIRAQKTNVEAEIQKPSCSKINTRITKPKPQNPLFSFEEQDTEDDEDFMPRPLIVKQENESLTPAKISIQQRFNVDCEDCEKLINFLDGRLTDSQIQQHLDKCKCHNNQNIRRQNTPEDFWNPFILSFQADDPRNDVLIDDRFKENKN